ncbi:MAG: hypothetical protein JRN37_08245 [Nitrososphaerota archaeon]|jgi:hypothetical protein|nr:hypothetical protein [Nitrososphaerota archaeon]MDG7039121.1 hypothetical protein [Nitrososphaerota archaeon]
MPSGVRKRRKGVSRTTTALAVVIIIIIIGVALFMLLSAGGLANIGIGGNGSSANSTVPAQLIATSTNPVLEASIAPPGAVLLYYKPIVLQPNMNYSFPITLTVENSAGRVLNTTITIFPLNFTSVYTPKENVLFYMSPSSGVSPFNTTLVIVTGSTVNFGQSAAVVYSLNFESSLPPNVTPSAILFTNSSYKF